MITKVQPTPTAEKRLNAHEITKLLAEKHKEDVFVDQCKDGPTQGSRVLILDGWAMKKSWANPCVTGYEIKVSRSDFQRDDKWYGYLPYCNEFYFVCPAGMLKPEEIPEPAGLICASKTGGTLFRKKKATRRDVIVPDTIYQYILMSRVKVTREGRGETKREFWEKWLENEVLDQRFGWTVRGRLAKVVADRITKVEQENKSLKDKMQRYDGLRKTIEALGLDPDRWWVSAGDVQHAVDKVRAAIPPELKAAVNSLNRSLMDFQKELSKLEVPVSGSQKSTIEEEADTNP